MQIPVASIFGHQPNCLKVLVRSGHGENGLRNWRNFRRVRGGWLKDGASSQDQDGRKNEAGSEACPHRYARSQNSFTWVPTFAKPNNSSICSL